MPRRSKSCYYRHLGIIFIGSFGTAVTAGTVSAYVAARLEARRIAQLLPPSPPPTTVVVQMPSFWQRAYEETKINPPGNRLRVLETYVREANNDGYRPALPVSGLPVFVDLLESPGDRKRVSELLEPFLVAREESPRDRKQSPLVTDGNEHVHPAGGKSVN